MSSSRIHILYIAEFSTGGSIESLLCLIGGLDQSRFKSTVLFYEMPDEAMCARLESTGATIRFIHPRSTSPGAPKDLQKRNLQSKIRRIFGQRIERLYASVKYVLYFLRFRLTIFKAIRRHIQQLQPDLVHLNNGVGTDTPGIMAARACKTPAVCHIRAFSTLTHVNVAAARKVSAFLCISSAIREHTIESGIAADRCIVVPNAVNPEKFNESTLSPAPVRAEYGWGESHKIFAVIGRVVSWKGQDVFIEAIFEAWKADKTIRGLIVGEGDSTPGNEKYIERLHDTVSSLGLEDIVKFTGHRRDIPEIMKSADCIVCPSSLPEPFGRVIIESMAVGTSVIATNAGGAPDIITDGVDGLLVSIGDSGALANAILQLSNDASFVQDIQTAAMRTVATKFTIERHVEQICKIYRSVLAVPDIN